MYTTFATTWMDLQGIMLNEKSETEKDKLLYVDSKKKKKTKHTKRDQIHSYQSQGTGW